MSDQAELPRVRRVAVVMARRVVPGRWGGEAWEAVGILPDESAPGAAYRTLREGPETTQLLFPGLAVRLHRDEAEGYHLNITSPQPKVFVLWRMADEGHARPEMVTVSYHEGSRWMDSDERVDGVPLPPEFVPWMAAFVAAHYRPEPRKGGRYATNKDRGRMGRIE